MATVYHEDRETGDMQMETFEQDVLADRRFWSLVSIASESYTGLKMTIVAHLNSIKAQIKRQGQNLVTVEVSF